MAEKTEIKKNKKIFLDMVFLDYKQPNKMTAELFLVILKYRASICAKMTFLDIFFDNYLCWQKIVQTCQTRMMRACIDDLIFGE